MLGLLLRAESREHKTEFDDSAFGHSPTAVTTLAVDSTSEVQ